MWTNENRGRYDRSKLRYPSDLTDEEWALIGPLIPPAKRGGNKRTVNERDIVDGVMYILSTGCQWAATRRDLSYQFSLGRPCVGPHGVGRDGVRVAKCGIQARPRASFAGKALPRLCND